METKIERTQIIGTKMVDYSAWVLDSSYEGSCTISFDGNGRRWVRIGTDPRKRSEWMNLGGFQRSDAVRADYKEREELAYRLILQAYPHLQGLRKFAGEITEVIS